MGRGMQELTMGGAGTDGRSMASFYRGDWEGGAGGGSLKVASGYGHNTQTF